MTSSQHDSTTATQGDGKHRAGRLGLVVGITVGAVMTTCVAAFAASLSITGGTIGTSANDQLSPCGNTAWTWANTRTRYVSSGDRYEIASIDLTVPAACQAPAVFRMVVMNNSTGTDPTTPVGNGNASPNDGALTGTFGAGPSTETWTSGQGPLLDNVDNADPAVRFLVMIRG